MAITYRTDGAWGSGIGAPLSAAQVDANFFELATRIATIEGGQLSTVNPITNIATNGTQMTITLEDSSTFGPFTLPTAQTTFRGVWEPLTEYEELDMVFATGLGLFLVRIAHTSEASFDQDFNIDSQRVYQRLAPPGLGAEFYLSCAEDLTGAPLEAGQIMCEVEPRFGVQFQAGLPFSFAHTFYQPLGGDAVCTILHQGEFEIGTITFRQYENYGRFNFPSNVYIDINQGISVVAPATPVFGFAKPGVKLIGLIDTYTVGTVLDTGQV